jgi:hypothetical protein
MFRIKFDISNIITRFKNQIISKAIPAKAAKSGLLG